MRTRTASEIINALEIRVARLEKSAGFFDLFGGKEPHLKALEKAIEGISPIEITDVDISHTRYVHELKLSIDFRGETYNFDLKDEPRRGRVVVDTLPLRPVVINIPQHGKINIDAFKEMFLSYAARHEENLKRRAMGWGDY